MLDVALLIWDHTINFFFEAVLEARVQGVGVPNRQAPYAKCTEYVGCETAWNWPLHIGGRWIQKAYLALSFG